jgi:Fur family ferric uptake transcriptional regulator
VRSEPTYRMTRQRAAVLSALQQFCRSGTHPTTDEVYIEVRRTMPRISLATVYRNLDVLAQQGHVQKLDLACSPVRFDGDPSPHMHIRCVRCGRVDDLDGIHLDIKNPDTDLSRGYEVIAVRAEFVGVCPTCCGIGAGDTRIGHACGQ